MKEPLLRYIKCHRGSKADPLRAAIDLFPDHYTTIKKGPLKGCKRRIVGSNLRAVFKMGRGFVLEFHVVIRPGWPESLSA